MLASVFAMQSIGQCLATIVALILVESHVAFDSMWRFIYGLGAVAPAVVLFARASIPESPRYTFDVGRNPEKANADIAMVRDRSQGISLSKKDEDARNTSLTSPQYPERSITEPDLPPIASRADFYQYIITQGNWRHLIATAGTWFLLDLSFYGLGLNSPQIIAKIWNGPKNRNDSIFDGVLTNASSTDNSTGIYNASTTALLSDWESEPNVGPWTVFRDNAFHAVIIVSLDSISGSLLLIWLVNYTSRKRLQILSFSLLAVFFLFIGLILRIVQQDTGALSIVILILYTFAQLLFNLGELTTRVHPLYEY